MIRAARWFQRQRLSCSKAPPPKPVPVRGLNTNLPFTAGGGRYQTNDILLDGIDNNTIATGGSIGYNGIDFLPSVDAVAEFKVKTNNYSAEFGRSAGTIVSAITK